MEVVDIFEPAKKDLIERLTWTFCQDYNGDVEGFMMVTADFKELQELFRIKTTEEFQELMAVRAKELDCDLEFVLEVDGVNTHVTWRPAVRDAE